MSSGGPKVSVVMAVFNGGDALAGTLESVLSQTGCDFELIVIDDGSNDATADVLAHFGRRASMIRIFHQPNSGLTKALIRGCELARGDFIARQDCGDISLPERLATQAAYLDSHPDCVVVGCDFEVLGPKGELLRLHRGSQDGSKDLFDRRGSPVSGPHHGTVMFRRDAYLLAGGYRDAFYFAQDVDLWTRLLEIGDLEYVPSVLCKTIFDANGISGRHRAAQEALRSLILDAARARKAGGDEAMQLARAREIRPVRGGVPDPAARRGSEAEAAYFIGSCLLERRDARSRGYFLQALRLRPSHWRTWLKLARSFVR